MYTNLTIYSYFIFSKVQIMYWTRKVTNEHIRNITGQPSLVETIRRRRWSYLGHVLRMDDSRIPKSTFFWLPEGTHHGGRPKYTPSYLQQRPAAPSRLNTARVGRHRRSRKFQRRLETLLGRLGRLWRHRRI